jgi:hypothetical protein
MWLQTYTGKRFDPLNPDPALIDIDDIAHALSNICRFGGHSSRFYSVAEHSVLVAEALWDLRHDADLALAGLLHDAAEAYLGDIPRPLKYRPEFAFYRKAEAVLEALICSRFALSSAWHPEIKRIDNAILADEARAFMGNPGPSWGLTESGLGLAFDNTGPSRYWREAFLLRFREWSK